MLNHFAFEKNRVIGKPHIILTSAFSHVKPIHIGSNMLSLWMYAPPVVRILGYRGFAYFYIGSAYASDFLDHLFFVPLKQVILARLKQRHTNDLSLGASGAISAVEMFHCLALPHRVWIVKGVEVSPQVNPIVWTLDDLLNLGKDDGIGHGAHLGGYLFGILLFTWRHVEKKGIRTVFMTALENVLDSLSD